MSDQPVPGQPSAQAGPNPAGWPDGDWPDDEDWPNEDNLAFPWPDLEVPWPGTEPPPPPSWRRHATGLVVAAVLAAGAGVGLALSFDGSGGGTPAAGSSSPTASAPRGGSSNGTLPGGQTGPGGVTNPSGGGAPGSGTQLMVIGQISAVSSTSITLAAGGQTITAAITSATKITGNVHNVASLATGDTVSAQIAVTNGKPTATAIQDPPEQEQFPAGSVP